MGKDQKPSGKSSTSSCADLRIAYNSCFNKWVFSPSESALFALSILNLCSRWYSEKFLKGQWDEEECCAVDWQKYRNCLSEHLDDKLLSRFLEADSVLDSGKQADPEKSS
ncbi:PREDICTED: uncharacterized protein At4g33100 isoform X1 [Tarenaya hassleriana]|uniref:uncharacterized protein At4g33100 isoform X1 n=1 Tax=Tarenaya hassleriana TaxID=28532 RepID=UPI00053C8D69|nr:PREDICTED: uncharacterized protein At4g33100 isoform X1 [Tarenaya hassleriana]